MVAKAIATTQSNDIGSAVYFLEQLLKQSVCDLSRSNKLIIVWLRQRHTEIVVCKQATEGFLVPALLQKNLI